jgi:hypothetical protein
MIVQLRKKIMMFCTIKNISLFNLKYNMKYNIKPLDNIVPRNKNVQNLKCFINYSLINICLVKF